MLTDSNAMTLEHLIEEYKTLPPLCDNIDFANPDAIRKNNDAIKRMVKIVKAVKREFGPKGISHLKKLLDIQDHKTNLWIATHLLENVELDPETENKAVNIVKTVSATDPILKSSYEHWIQNWKFRNGIQE